MIDVDKLDYLKRDALTLNISEVYDYRPLLQHSKVINDDICYDREIANDVWNLFRTRMMMFKTVYCSEST